MFCLTSNTHYGLRGCDVFNLVYMHRSDPRSIGVVDRLIILHPFKLIASITDDVRRNSYTCGNLSLLAPYFGLFQWHIGAPDRLEPQEAACLACLLVQPWIYTVSVESVCHITQRHIPEVQYAMGTSNYVNWKAYFGPFLLRYSPGSWYFVEMSGIVPARRPCAGAGWVLDSAVTAPTGYRTPVLS
jgi:hypothetical protein